MNFYTHEVILLKNRMNGEITDCCLCMSNHSPWNNKSFKVLISKYLNFIFNWCLSSSFEWLLSWNCQFETACPVPGFLCFLFLTFLLFLSSLIIWFLLYLCVSVYFNVKLLYKYISLSFCLIFYYISMFSFCKLWLNFSAIFMISHFTYGK